MMSDGLIGRVCRASKLIHSTKSSRGRGRGPANNRRSKRRLVQATGTTDHIVKSARTPAVSRRRHRPPGATTRRPRTRRLCAARQMAPPKEWPNSMVGPIWVTTSSSHCPYQESALPVPAQSALKPGCPGTSTATTRKDSARTVSSGKVVAALNRSPATTTTVGPSPASTRCVVEPAASTTVR